MDRNKLVKLLNRCNSYEEAGKHLSCSRQNIYILIKKYNIKKKKSTEMVDRVYIYQRPKNVFHYY